MPEAPSPSSPSLDALTLGAILNSAVAGIITIDASGIIHTVNPSLQRMFGYRAEEIVGRNVSVLVPEPHRGAHDSYMGDYMRGGRSRVVGVGREVIGRRKDGSTFPMHLSVGEYFSNDKRYFTGVVIDLSAEKAAEERFRRQQALFEAIFEHLPDPVIIANVERIVQHVNPAFRRVFGYEAGELVGRPAALIYEQIADIERELPARPTRTFGGDEPRAQLLNYRRKSGELFPAMSLRNLVIDRMGRELGYLCVIRDISEDVRREAVLMKSQRMEAIGQLTGGVAHDFNNILTVILGNLEMLDGKLTRELDLSLSREAQEAAEMGARLTDRLLTFARRQHLEIKTVDLNQLVLGLIELLRRSIGEDIDLSTALAGDLWPTDADPGQIENALLNLAINARDAMPGGGRIVIETRNVSLDATAVAMAPGLAVGDYVLLAVSDTGAGMTPEVKERAFEPFFTTKPVGKGSGLGLATIYGFARQSGGNVSIYSEVGKGTTVNLYLPRRVPEQSPDDSPDTSGADTRTGQGETILVVEDDARVRRLTCTRLESLGYRVIAADTGARARAMLDAGEAVDLVFTDLVMPGGVSGLDLARHVRETQPSVAVLLTSGYAEELVNVDGVSGLGARLLRKPYRQADLAEAVRAALAEG